VTVGAQVEKRCHIRDAMRVPLAKVCRIVASTHARMHAAMQRRASDRTHAPRTLIACFTRLVATTKLSLTT